MNQIKHLFSCIINPITALLNFGKYIRTEKEITETPNEEEPCQSSFSIQPINNKPCQTSPINTLPIIPYNTNWILVCDEYLFRY